MLGEHAREEVGTMDWTERQSSVAAFACGVNAVARIAAILGLVAGGALHAAEDATNAVKLKAIVHFRPQLADPRKGLDPEIFKGGTLWLDHSAGYMVPKYLYYDEHPEYYAKRLNGKRIPKSTRDSYIHLCMSNPHVVRISTERMLGWMRLQKDKRFFCVTQGDGPDWCQCEQCKGMDVETGNYSDRMLKFVNQIARAVKKEFPDKILLTLAYVGTDTAPVLERPEENVWVMYCPFWGVALSEVHSLTHPSNAEALKQLEAWLKAAPDNMAIYDYNMKFCPSWDAMAAKIKWYSAKGIRGIWFCGSPSCFRDLFEHVVRQEMIRDPNQEPEKLKRDYVNAKYGAAAPHVMEYLTLVTLRLEKGYPRGMHNYHMPADFYLDEGFGEKCLDLFDKMIEASKGNAGLEKKFRSERAMFVRDQKAALAARKRKGKYNPTAPEKIEGGIRLPATAFVEGRGPMEYGWFCEPRTAMLVYAARGPHPTSMNAKFVLDSVPDKATLKMEAQDADKDYPPSTPLRITINGRKVFEGPCEFMKRGWSWRSFAIEKGILQKGTNTIQITNTMDSARIDHYWFMMAEAQIVWE